MKRKYPIGLQDFQEIRNGGYLYVDKTRQINNLVGEGKYYFLSRPRRFGKSLLLSTLKYLFQGEKSLFKGLWIEDQWDWEQRNPVIHLSFSSIGYKTQGLDVALTRRIEELAGEHHVELKEHAFDQQFRELIKSVAERDGKVVLLLDEYDKPLVDYMDDQVHAETNRAILKSFYSVLKDSDPYLRFFFITGVSKFSRVSIFSDLNNLNDITLSQHFDDICGYSQAELEDVFAPEIAHLEEAYSLPKTALLDKIKTWYNGYSWDGPHRMYNPFSILNLFFHGRFSNFWWETGTPTFLMQRLRRSFQFELENYMGGTDLFESYTLGSEDTASLLFQTGYLTIKEVNEELRLYTLGYPNLEVKDAMYRHLLGAFRHTTTTESQLLFARMKLALDVKDMDTFIQQINALFASIPYQIFIQHQEKYFHSILHIAFHAVGLFIQSEVSTSAGRVDCILQNEKYIFIAELKLDQTVETDLNQIRDKRYGAPYLGQDKEVLAVGISFSSETKAVENWEVIPYEKLVIK